jgi:hypothetical protein
MWQKSVDCKEIKVYLTRIDPLLRCLPGEIPESGLLAMNVQ